MSEELKQMLVDLGNEVKKYVTKEDIESIKKDVISVMEDMTKLKNSSLEKINLGTGSKPLSQGWKSFGEQLMAVRKFQITGGREMDQRLIFGKAPLGMNETVPSEGGFLVDQDVSAALLERVHETGLLAPKCTHYPISGVANSIKIKVIDETSRALGSRYGGIQLYWVAEAGTISASKPKFKTINMTLEKIVGLYYATEEELQDVPFLERRCSDMFIKEFGFMIDDAIVNGTGSGQPLGILNAGCLVSQAAETGQVAATIVAENVIKMYSRMWPPSIPNGIWLVNINTYPQLWTMSLAVGTGGIPVFLPPNGISGTPYGTLFARPIQPIEQAAGLGTVGDIIFCDLSQYLMIEKGPIKTDSSIHVAFLTDEQAFRFTYRLNGQPQDSSALTPYKGTASTLSSFVALASRT